MPPTLQELMRHESIETTLNYYVGHNAQQTAHLLWQQFGSEAQKGTILGNSTPFSPLQPPEETAGNLYWERGLESEGAGT